MRQVCIIRHGPPEVLTLQGAPEPRVTPGMVRIAVQAIGVNFADRARAGTACPGADALWGVC